MSNPSLIVPPEMAQAQQGRQMIQMLRTDVAKGILAQLAGVEYANAKDTFEENILAYEQAALEGATLCGMTYKDGEYTKDGQPLPREIEDELVIKGELPRRPVLQFNELLIIEVAANTANAFLARMGFLRQVPDGDPRTSIGGD